LTGISTVKIAAFMSMQAIHPMIYSDIAFGLLTEPKSCKISNLSKYDDIGFISCEWDPLYLFSEF